MLWENIKSMAEQLFDKEATCMLHAKCLCHSNSYVDFSWYLEIQPLGGDQMIRMEPS